MQPCSRCSQAPGPQDQDHWSDVRALVTTPETAAALIIPALDAMRMRDAAL